MEYLASSPSNSTEITPINFYPKFIGMRSQRLRLKLIFGHFETVGAAERYRVVRYRKFCVQNSLRPKDENLFDVKMVVVDAGLIYTVIDSVPFSPDVVREFMVNLLDAEERGDGVVVYVRGSLVDFNPSLINSMYCIPGFEEEPDWKTENIDHVCAYLTKNQVRRWENMISKFLTATNQVLHKLVCSKWIPSTSYDAGSSQVSLLLHRQSGFGFGRLVYDQIIKLPHHNDDNQRTICFSTLIQQVLLIQRNVPPDSIDEYFTGFPKPVVKDTKADEYHELS